MCAIIDFILNIIANLFSVAVEGLIKNLWDNLVFWRLSSLALLIIVVSAFLLRKKIVSILRKEDIVNHDRECFNRLDAIMDERRLEDYLSEIDTNHRYWVLRDSSSPHLVLYRLVNHYQEQTNKFNMRKLDRICTKLMNTITGFTAFVGTNFFMDDPITDVGYEMVLRSEWTVDRGATQEQMRLYAEVADRLEKHVDELRRDYRLFRKAVRETLFI